MPWRGPSARLTIRAARTGALWVAACLVTTLAFAGCSDTSSDGGQRDLGGETAPAQAGAVSLDDFAGSGACRGCHADQYASWVSSTHGRAGGMPTPETVIAPFDGTPIAFRDGAVTPQVDSTGRYVFLVREDGSPDRVVTVDGVIGGGHMLGGGTQGFVTRTSDGTVRFLPFDYSRQLDTWFCNTDTRADRGWVPITANMALADCGDWPPVRMLGTHARFANCQSCHGSQITAEFAPGQGMSTRWTSLDVNCESCHGPAKRHAELMAAGSPADGDIALVSRVTDGVEESLEVCFACHALKDVVQEGYLPGAPLTDYHALKLPVLGDDPYLPDGRVRTFAYQATHLSSACYVDGGMTCVSCHEPHGLGYWDINRTPLASETDDRQCTSCHASKADDPVAHTFHPPESPGSRCVWCHMPYLQHPEVGDAVPFARSDHTIPVPRPALDGRLGLVSACRGCHTDQSELGLQARVDEWWGTLRPHDAPTAGLLAVTDGMGEDLAARLLLHPEERGDMASFQALARFAGGWMTPGEPLGAEAGARITQMASSPDPDLRALALAILHAAGPASGGLSVEPSPSGAGPGATLDLDAAINREPLPVRRRWVMILGFFSDEATGRGDLGAAEDLLVRALSVTPGDAGVLRSLGLVASQAGDHAGAIQHFTESLEADPNQPLVHVNRGIAYAAAGDPAAAIRDYQSAAALNPYEPLAHFNLGNVHLRGGDLAEAIRAYERAIAAGPELARAHVNLAIALAQAGRVQEALAHARTGASFAPGDETARQVLSQLEAAVPGSP